ncbi:alpha-L-fucosidase [Vallitalea okinawensis]|uniref:alpha-L-fucosidase n=1 Tax=Vallitalea okinawensis TaxID=2078660 RepID=UPI001A9A5E07|nr:alpha-L-fucosidase [Vallitalea okinawensis]
MKNVMSKGEFFFTEGPFKETWDSLKQYKCPDWFRDAKFGMWAHWGPQAVPGEGDWYARNMYIEGSEQYKYHCKNYGHPSEFGYKDIVKLWRAENFNPSEIIKLYKRAGAKYFIALAVHHDNFDCWDSTYHKWNSVNMGPENDIVGMWKEAALEEGLHFGVTVHHERSYSWFNTNKGSDRDGKYAMVPYDGNDRRYSELYYENHPDRSMSYPVNPSYEFVWNWYARIYDIVEKYSPDLLYTDGGVPFGDIGRKMIANLYNASIKHNGSLETVYNLKNFVQSDAKSGHYHGEYEEGIGVQDLERGVISDIKDVPWQTDTCLGGWYYNRHQSYKTAEQVIHMLVDIVSKNGNLLLNVPLRADGTIDETSMHVIEGISEWMAINGEAIYETRPWITFGEGEIMSSGGSFNEDKINYTAKDFRFTKKGNLLYAINLAWAEGGYTTIQSLSSEGIEVEKVELLGCNETIIWSQDSEEIKIQVPEKKPCDIAYVYKLTLKN